MTGHAMVEDTFVVLRVLHLTHNNLSSQVKDATRTLGDNPLAALSFASLPVVWRPMPFLPLLGA